LEEITAGLESDKVVFMETTVLSNQDARSLALFGPEDNPELVPALRLTPALDRVYPIVDGQAIPLLTLRMHEDGTASIRVGHRWLHNLWPDKRLQLLTSVRRYNGHNGNGNDGSKILASQRPVEGRST